MSVDVFPSQKRPVQSTLRLVKRAVRGVLASIAPEWERRNAEARWTRQQARELKTCLLAEAPLEARVDVARKLAFVQSNQKRAEILSLLEQVAALRPTTLCEIGADRGGTLALIASVAAPEAHILSIDIAYPGARAKLYEQLKGRRQRVTCLEADSHAAQTLDRVRSWLGGRQFDFLFIDGDHTYDGVKSDYTMYSPLVRRGGLIAFHDIVSDYKTRFGAETSSWVGEVPRFWTELKASGITCSELIETPDQDGYGIGLVRV